MRYCSRRAGLAGPSAPAEVGVRGALLRQLALDPVGRRPGRLRQRQLAAQPARRIDHGVEQQPRADRRLVAVGAGCAALALGLGVEPVDLGAQLADLLLAGGRRRPRPAAGPRRPPPRPSRRRRWRHAGRCGSRPGSAAAGCSRSSGRRARCGAACARRAGPARHPPPWPAAARGRPRGPRRSCVARSATRDTASASTPSHPSGRSSQARAASSTGSASRGASVRSASGAGSLPTTWADTRSRKSSSASRAATMAVPPSRARRAGAKSATFRSDAGSFGTEGRTSAVNPRTRLRTSSGSPASPAGELSTDMARPVRQPVAASSETSARSTTSIASARPHQRQVTDSTVSPSTSVSSTRCSPARSKCQNSLVRRVRRHVEAGQVAASGTPPPLGGVGDRGGLGAHRAPCRRYVVDACFPA